MLDAYLIGFLAIVGFVVVAVIAAVERIPADRRAELGPIARHPRIAALVWLVSTSVPTLAGLMAPAGPLPPQAVMVLVMVAAITFSVSSIGGAIAATAPLHLLVGFQGFRFPLELVLHGWAEQGIAPPQMTWTGSNLDIFAGIVALVAIPAVKRWPGSAWAPTVIGSLLIANVLRVVAQSLPGPLQSFPDLITLPSLFPHVWIGMVCVPAAVAGHVIAIRALLALPASADS